MQHTAIILLLLAGTALLGYAALHDVGFRTVPNRISAALLICGVLLRLIEGDIMWGTICGLIVFAVTYAFWRLGWMGGADVKLLTASAVFVAPSAVLTMLLGTSLAGGLLAGLYIVASRVVPRPKPARPSGLLRRAARCELRRLRHRGPLPYAVAIATGGLLAILSA